MASKLAAAKIAAWSGVRAVIAAATADDVVGDALAGKPVGTAFAPRAAAPVEPQALDRVRAGRRGSHRRRRRRARRARRRRQVAARRRACAAVEGDFDVDAAVEIVDERRRGVRQGPQSATPSPQLRARRRPPHGRPPRRPPARSRPPRRPRRPAVVGRQPGSAGTSPCAGLARRHHRPPCPARYLMRSCECVIGIRCHRAPPSCPSAFEVARQP